MDAYQQIPPTDQHYQAAQLEVANHIRFASDDLYDAKKIAVVDG